MTCERIGENPHSKDWKDADHWKVVFSRKVEGKVDYHDRKTGIASKRSWNLRMTTYFSMGYGHNGNEPTPEDLLSCLASDAEGVDVYKFEEWADNLGYDADSRKAEKIYKACEHGAKRLKQFLGEDLYKTLVHGTERN